MKKVKAILSLAILLGTITIATSANAVDVVEKDGNKNTSNEIDDTYNAQKGWSFYFDQKNDSNLSKTQKTQKVAKRLELHVLQKILDENRKQTKIQKKVLALLQKQIDPKPKIITVNGKKCVANSSANCFDFGALLIAEAKKVPVMAEFLKDPYDIKKAAKYLQWQAKYFKHAINVGNSLQFAYSQFGEKAYPIGAQSTQYTVGSGNFEGGMLPDAQKRLIISMKDKISYSIFIGKNITMDMYSALSVVNIIKQYGTMNIDLIFWDKKSKDVFMGAVSSVWKVPMIKNWKNVKKEISPKKFKQYQIFATPSYVLKLNNKGKKEALTILHGKVDESSFRSRTMAFLELKKLINYQKFTEQNIWESKGGKKAVKKLFSDEYNVKVKIPNSKKDLK
jgi:hypothetical protein